MSIPQIYLWGDTEISNGLRKIKNSEKISISNKVIPFLTNLLWKIAYKLLIEASDRTEREWVELDDIIGAYRDLKLDGAGRWILDETTEDELFIALNEAMGEESELWIDRILISDLMRDISEKRMRREASMFVVFYLEAYARQTLKRAQARVEGMVRLKDIKSVLEM